MLFNTLVYAEFFGVVFVVSWLLARQRKLRLFFLLAASYFFYAKWDFRFVPLIWASSTADWLLGIDGGALPKDAERLAKQIAALPPARRKAVATLVTHLRKS